MQTYLNAIVNEALEMAAKECEEMSRAAFNPKATALTDIPNVQSCAYAHCAQSIRKLKV